MRLLTSHKGGNALTVPRLPFCSSQVYRLPAGKIFCDASRVLALRQLYGDIRLILQCIQKSRFSSDALNDEIIMAAIKVLASQTKEVCTAVCMQ